MKGTLRVAHSELFRLVRSRSGLVALVVLALVSGVRVVAARLAGGLPDARALATGAGPEPHATNAWAPFIDGWSMGLELGTLLLLVHAARSLAADRTNGVVRLSVTRSSSRAALVLGRALLAPLPIVAVVAVTGASAFLAARTLFTFGPIVVDGYELIATHELVFELRRTLLATGLPLFATFAFGLFVSCAARTPAGAVTTALTTWLAFDLFKDALGPARIWIFATFAPTLLDRSAWSEFAGVARGYSDAGLSEELWRMNLFVPGPWALLWLALACNLVARRAL